MKNLERFISAVTAEFLQKRIDGLNEVKGDFRSPYLMDAAGLRRLEEAIKGDPEADNVEKVNTLADQEISKQLSELPLGIRRALNFKEVGPDSHILELRERIKKDILACTARKEEMAFDFDSRLKKQWDDDPAIRQEFLNDFASYRAFMRHYEK